MQLKVKETLIFALLGGFFAISALAADDIKYAAIQKEDGQWKVVSISDTIPTYQDGMEILALPKFVPQFDERFQVARSQYGGIDCPSVPDKSMYTPCNSYFYRFVGANWFGLGGVRVGFRGERFAEVKNAILLDENIASIKAKADEAAAARTQAANAQARAQRDAEYTQRLDRERKEEERYQSLAAGNFEKMAKMERGVEDSCKRKLDYIVIVKTDPEYAKIKCQFGGEVTLEGLPNAGWLVVSKTKDSDGVVTDYFVRKAR